MMVARFFIFWLIMSALFALIKAKSDRVAISFNALQFLPECSAAASYLLLGILRAGIF